MSVYVQSRRRTAGRAQKKSEAFRLLGSCSRLSVSDVRSCELGVFVLFGVGVLEGVDGPPKGDLQLATLCEGDGV